jgi:DNA-binding HxlR family transcriptional regulator
MQRTSFRDMNCAVAQCLDVVGEWWSLLIVRDAFLGYSRFDDFQERLGISRNVLNQRLTRLVDEGVFERVAYQDNPPRYDYRLTEKGHDLFQVLGAMRKWGQKWSSSPGGDLTAGHDWVHRECGTQVRLETRCPQCDVVLSPADVQAVPNDRTPASHG